MLVDEMSHNFVRKNSYNYSNCPLKKRPFYYTSDEEETSETIKGKCRISNTFIYLLCKDRHKKLLSNMKYIYK